MQVICCVFWQSRRRLSVLAGRSETMVEYDVGLLPNGKITALKIRGYFLCGAFLDLGFNDMMVLQQGVDQVCLILWQNLVKIGSR
jgi:hypothetical protein